MLGQVLDRLVKVGLYQAVDILHRLAAVAVKSRVVLDNGFRERHRPEQTHEVEIGVRPEKQSFPFELRAVGLADIVQSRKHRITAVYHIVAIRPDGAADAQSRVPRTFVQPDVVVGIVALVVVGLVSGKSVDEIHVFRHGPEIVICIEKNVLHLAVIPAVGLHLHGVGRILVERRVAAGIQAEHGRAQKQNR